MNKFLAFSLFTFAFSFVATAVPSYWAAVETTAATGDTSGGANQDLYSTYCWTVEKAAGLFKVEGTVDAVETYLANNFAAGRSALAASAVTAPAAEIVSADKAAQLTAEGYVDGLYGFRATYGDALSSSVLGSEYLALLFYENGTDQEFRLMTTTLENGNLHFSADPFETVGNPGTWQQAVPEPTSALLILLGVAGLALKRKRVDASTIDPSDALSRLPPLAAVLCYNHPHVQQHGLSQDRCPVGVGRHAARRGRAL